MTWAVKPVIMCIRAAGDLLYTQQTQCMQHNSMRERQKRTEAPVSPKLLVSVLVTCKPTKQYVKSCSSSNLWNRVDISEVKQAGNWKFSSKYYNAA